MRTFDDYLEEAHAKDYHGTDDNMPDAYEAWLSDLDGEEYILMANMALEKTRAGFKELIMQIKYKNHNPKVGCDCSICEICDELLLKINDQR